MRTLNRAAASSSANGNRSSRAQILSTAIRSSSRSSRFRATPRARSMKSSTASSRASGVTGYSRSPATRRASRLVTKNVRFGAEAEMRATIIAAAGSSCSRLSNSRSDRRAPRWCTSTSSAPRSALSRKPSVVAIVPISKSGSASDASATNATPPGKWSKLARYSSGRPGKPPGQPCRPTPPPGSDHCAEASGSPDNR